MTKKKKAKAMPVKSKIFTMVTSLYFIFHWENKAVLLSVHNLTHIKPKFQSEFIINVSSVSSWDFAGSVVMALSAFLNVPWWGSLDLLNFGRKKKETFPCWQQKYS